MSKSRIRQADIAREAGVSVATVDRVLNARPGVAEHTTQRIRDALKRLTSRQGLLETGRPEHLAFDFVLPAGPNTFMAMLERAASEAGNAFSERGVTVRCHRVEGFNARILAERIRTLRETSNGLAVVALENPIVREAVSNAMDRGVPVVTLVSNLTTPKKTGYVGLDNRAAGRTAGYLMGRFVRATTGKVVMLEGSLELSYRDHQERELGFRDALREYTPSLEIAGRWQTQDNFEESYRQTQRILDAHPDLLGLYSIGSGVRGIAHALVEREVFDRVVFIAHDLTEYTRAFLIDGVVDAVIHQHPDRLARLAVETLLAEYEDSPRPAPVPLAANVFFRENLP